MKERSDSILNNLILVGRVVEDAKLITLETGVKVSNFVLAVQRPFKNEKMNMKQILFLFNYGMQLPISPMIIVQKVQ